MMFENLRVQLLGCVLLIVLLGFVWMQQRLNHELGNELSQANAQIQQMNKSIVDSNAKQNEFSDKISQLEITQYNNQMTLKKKLDDISHKPVAEQSTDYNDAYDTVLGCIEKKSMGLKCE